MDNELEFDKLLELLDSLLDFRCELYGVRNTIALLMDLDLSKEEIIDLGFDDTDVEYVFAHPYEEYDCE